LGGAALKGPATGPDQGVVKRSLLALLVGLSLVGMPGPSARASETCEPTGPVSLLLLQSGQKVRELAAALGEPIVARGPKTVVLADGRVITADPEAAGDVLNALGWGARPIQVVVSFPKTRRVRPRRIG
jgi:hypothetical protein